MFTVLILSSHASERKVGTKTTKNNNKWLTKPPFCTFGFSSQRSLTPLFLELCVWDFYYFYYFYYYYYYFFYFFYPTLVLAYSSGGGTVLGQMYSSVFFSFSSFFLPSLRRRSSQIPLKCAFELRGWNGWSLPTVKFVGECLSGQANGRNSTHQSTWRD